jgi:hypothetical protein
MNEVPEMNELKKRHGCLTAWLILMLILNAALALVYLFRAEAIADAHPGGIPQSLLMALRVLAGLNVVWTVLLLRWKRIGFWGFLVNTIAAFVVNLMIGLGLLSALPGLFGVIVLFLLLQLNAGSRSGWNNLE